MRVLFSICAGDVWAIVGWSQDLVTLAERSNSVEVSAFFFQSRCLAIVAEFLLLTICLLPSTQKCLNLYNTQAIVPASGTSLFADLWVVPKGAQGGNLQVDGV